MYHYNFIEDVKNMKLITHGKVKSVYQHEPGQVVIEYFDKVTAGNGEKVDFPSGKGALCCTISSILFQKLEEKGILTHYKGLITKHRMLCTQVDIVPIEVIVRNLAAGSIVRQTTFNEGKLFSKPLVEFHLKDDSKNDPLLTPDRMKLMGYDPETFIDTALKINSILIKIFYQIGLDLVDFKIEFGYTNDGRLMVADEISPDSMRLWSKGDKERFDKDLFRKDEGDIVPAYYYILEQLQKFV